MRLSAALAAIPLVLLAACNHGDAAQASGTGSQRSYQVGAFQRISVQGPYDAVVTVGGAPSVRAVGDSKALDQLEVRVENGQLIVGSKRNSMSWGFGSHQRTTVYVTAPSLSAATLLGSGDMKVDKVTGDRFEAQVHGSGGVDIASLRVGEAAFNLSGSGDLRAAGTADQVNVSVQGSGDFSAGGFQAKDATISVIGSGNAALRATQTAKVNVVGSGNAEIGGGAKCQVNKVGSGNVNCTG
jgi:hypothetical protein